MIIDLINLKSSKNITLEEDVTLNEDDKKKIDILKDIIDLKAIVKVELIHPYLMIKLNIKGKLVLYSTRSLKEVPYDLDESEEFTFLLEDIKNNDDDIEIIKGNTLDLYPYIYMLLVSSIPMKIVLDDDKEYLSGDSWELITEDEYNKRKKEPNSEFEKLKDFFDE